MTDPVDSVPTSSPANAPAQPAPATETPSQQTLPIRDAKSAKPKDPAQTDKPAKGKDASATAGTEADAAAGDKPLTPAELKKKAKAEKAARRVKEKLERDGGAGAAGGSAPAPGQPRPPATPRKDAAGGGATQKGSKALPPRRGSVVGAGAAVEQKKKKEDKSVAVFGHLYGQQRRTTIAGAGKEVHPAVLALGLQLRDYVVCGSSARCVATMLAFKRVSLIMSYIHLIWKMEMSLTLLTFEGRRILHYTIGYLASPPHDNPPLSSNHLPLHMSTALHQPR